MSSHQTIVVELGSSRIKVGFAGESKPRRVLNDSGGESDGGWSVGVSDGMVSNACNWNDFFRHVSSSISDPAADASATAVTTVYEWEKTLYPLFSHILTSILFIPRPSRHRMLLLINDAFPPRHFREALHRVLLEYLNVGGVWLVNGGVFESLYHLMEGLPPSLPSLGQPKAHLLVDIGTFESRVMVSVTGSSILADSYQSTTSGYDSFLRQVLTNYQQTDEAAAAESEQSEKGESLVSTLGDANAIVQAWAACSTSPEMTTISVGLPSQHKPQTDSESTTQLSIQPLLEAFHQIYLDYSNPLSLIFAILTCVKTCPIDYRKAVLQNIMLLGGGSVALHNFGSLGSASGLTAQLEMAAREACGVTEDENMEECKEEEKKEDDTQSLSSIAKHHFQCLSGAVRGGVNIQYPDPFAADMSAWIGGSMMGTLGSKHYQKKM